MDSFGALATVLGVSAVGGMAARALGLPVVLGYIMAGIGISALGGTAGGWGGTLELMGKVGVTLLLFSVGLELSLAEIKRLGRTVFLTGVGQIAVTTIIGFALARGLGFDVAGSLYIGVALTFSSTVVVVKLLTEKGDLNSLHGRLAVGSLLVQDFVAIGILMLLSGVNFSDGGLVGLGVVLAKGVILVVATFVLAEKVLPRIVEALSGWGEVLFVVSISWCLILAAVAGSETIGLTSEIGGFLAGLSLANAAAHLQITIRIRPLRDFFLVLFFVWLGAGVDLRHIGGVGLAAAVLSMYVVVGNPLIMMSILGFLGYKKRTAFLAGITMGQISEFSLVVVAAAVAAGQVDRGILGVVTLVGLVTMGTGSWVITNSELVYRRLGKRIPFYFNRAVRQESLVEKIGAGGVVLFGHGRTGSAVLPMAKKLRPNVTVVDFDPEVVRRLQNSGIAAIFGDMSDLEEYENLNLKSADAVISTVPDVKDSLQLLAFLGTGGGRKGRPTVVVTGANDNEAARLYKAGADYVLVPLRVGGEFLAHVLERNNMEKDKIAELGRLHWNRLAGKNGA